MTHFRREITTRVFGHASRLKMSSTARYKRISPPLIKGGLVRGASGLRSFCIKNSKKKRTMSLAQPRRKCRAMFRSLLHIVRALRNGTPRSHTLAHGWAADSHVARSALLFRIFYTKASEAASSAYEPPFN